MYIYTRVRDRVFILPVCVCVYVPCTRLSVLYLQFVDPDIRADGGIRPDAHELLYRARARGENERTPLHTG